MAHWKPTLDFEKQGLVYPKDSEPDVAKATIELFEKYGLEVPPEEWEAALAGTQGTYSKIKYSEDDVPDIRPEEVYSDGHIQACDIMFPEIYFRALFELTDSELATTDPFHFAKVQDKALPLSRALNSKIKPNSTKVQIETVISYYFYDKCTMCDFERQNYTFYYNSESKCGVMCYFGHPRFHYWFLDSTMEDVLMGSEN